MRKDLFGFLLFVVAIAFAVGVLWPKVNEVHEISVELKAKEQLVANKQDRLNDIQQLSATFSNQKDRLSKLISTLPSEPQIPEVLVSFEAMGNESGVTLTSLSPQISTRDKAVVMTLVGEGELSRIEKLMQNIADNDRPMSMSAVSMSRGTKGSTLSFNITVRIPYVPEAANTQAQGAL